mmetsp:Transcript_47603/g.89193  ORF Transcript_47603/g.89193 Transcript_47603/m.89193 type:complete len:217 (+) Transcript_47603:189-839(+)
MSLHYSKQFLQLRCRAGHWALGARALRDAWRRRGTVCWVLRGAWRRRGVGRQSVGDSLCPGADSLCPGAKVICPVSPFVLKGFFPCVPHILSLAFKLQAQSSVIFLLRMLEIGSHLLCVQCKLFNVACHICAEFFQLSRRVDYILPALREEVNVPVVVQFLEIAQSASMVRKGISLFSKCICSVCLVVFQCLCMLFCQCTQAIIHVVFESLHTLRC